MGAPNINRIVNDNINQCVSLTFECHFKLNDSY